MTHARYQIPGFKFVFMPSRLHWGIKNGSFDDSSMEALLKF